jgi:hypothetical protein
VSILDGNEQTASRPRLYNAEERVIGKLGMLGWPVCSVWKREKSVTLPGIPRVLSFF